MDGLSQVDSVMMFVEKMPEFKGGHEAMYSYIGQHIQYPLDAREKGIEGTVIVLFTVDSVGGISNIQITRGIGGGCDEEVVRIMNLMNDDHMWRPGYHEGKPVSVSFSLPMKFKLEGKVRKTKSKKNQHY